MVLRADEDYYNQALALTDDGFTQLYNIFNTLYQSQLIGKTLPKFVQSADAIPGTA